MSIVVIGLIVCVAIAILIVLLVALPGLRSEGRIPEGDSQTFRLPSEWTGFDDDETGNGLFGEPTGPIPQQPDDASSTAGPELSADGGRAGKKRSRRRARTASTPSGETTDSPAGDMGGAGETERGAVGTVEPDSPDTVDHSRLQSRRHALPPVWTGRPRTRHWRMPESGEGLKTSVKMFVG